jgi:hypothetical protein
MTHIIFNRVHADKKRIIILTQVSIVRPDEDIAAQGLSNGNIDTFRLLGYIFRLWDGITKSKKDQNCD